MKNKIIVLLTIIVLLAILVTPAAAKGITRTSFSGVEGGMTCLDPPLPCMIPGETQVLPNGKTIVRGLVMAIEFTTSDPRFTGINVVTFYMFPGSDQTTPGRGTFIFYPSTIDDGYWVGSVELILSNDGVRSTFTAKGHGSLDRQLLQGTNNNGQIQGVIIELPN